MNLNESNSVELIFKRFAPNVIQKIFRIGSETDIVVRTNVGSYMELTLMKVPERNSIRFNPCNFEICFQTILNHFKPIRKTFWISFDISWLKINLIHSGSIGGLNRNESKFEFIWIEFSIRSIPTSDLFRLMRIKNFV